MNRPRPETVFDQGLQHERTALAWERTAIASMVAGVLVGRYAAESLHVVFAFVGLAQVGMGAAVLVWTGRHYDDLHGPLRQGESPIHPLAARVVGLGTVGFSGAALVIAIAAAVR
ncbi:MAG: DUF202 domain-containing protein [Ilumatobacter sp.]|nr:DUF202 domain-containing protein [Ilumatobacter sp.]